MSGGLHIGLRAGERIYINGAVLSVDRKVRIELLNNATFLLGSHVMQLDQATTPLRQLYFLTQSLLMEPSIARTVGPAVESAISEISHREADVEVVRDLGRVGSLVSKGSSFEALKVLRQLIEKKDLAGGKAVRPNWEKAEVA